MVKIDSANMKLPNFIIIGAAKYGASTRYGTLTHTSIFEAHYPYDPGLLIEGGMCLNQINNYFRSCKKAPIHLMLFEEIVGNPFEGRLRLYDFLNVRKDNLLVNFQEQKDNVAGSHFDQLRLNHFVHVAKPTPLLAPAVKVLPEKQKYRLKKLLANSAFYRKKRSAIIPARMLPETRADLEKIYSVPTSKLSGFLGKGLIPYWGSYVRLMSNMQQFQLQRCTTREYD